VLCGHKPSGLDTWTLERLSQGPSFGTAIFLSKVEFLLAFPIELCQTPLFLLPSGVIHSTSVSPTKTPFSVKWIFKSSSSYHNSDHDFRLTFSQVTGAGDYLTKCALTGSEIFKIQSEQHWVGKIYDSFLSRVDHKMDLRF